MMTLWLTPSQPVNVETIVEAREAAIIFVEDEIAEGADPSLRGHEFRLYNRERVVGVVAGGCFFQAH